jgi:hypothetical protein
MVRGTHRRCVCRRCASVEYIELKVGILLGLKLPPGLPPPAFFFAACCGFICSCSFGVRSMDESSLASNRIDNCISFCFGIDLPSACCVATVVMIRWRTSSIHFG